MLNIVINLLVAVLIIVSLLMILVVLMQRPKSEGLGAAFGGGMTDNLFGAQTTNVLANFTRWLGGIFFVLTLALSVLVARKSAANKSATDIQRDLSAKPKPAAVAPAVPGSSEIPAIPGDAANPAPAVPAPVAPTAGSVEPKATTETPAVDASAPPAAPAPTTPAAPEAKP